MTPPNEVSCDIPTLVLLKEFGICRDKTELFYPEVGDAYAARKAKKICQECPVKTVCLDYAIKHFEMYGIWGGTTEKERRQLRVSQQRKVQSVR